MAGPRCAIPTGHIPCSPSARSASEGLSSSYLEQLSFESEFRQAELTQRQARRRLALVAAAMRSCLASNRPTVRILRASRGTALRERNGAGEGTLILDGLFFWGGGGEGGDALEQWPLAHAWLGEWLSSHPIVHHLPGHRSHS